MKFEVLDATFVKIKTDAGITGWGEGTPWGHTYVPAHGPGIRAGIETMAQALLGKDPRQLAHIERAMDLSLPGHLYAKAPIDLACWDIAGQAAGLSIADLLGGRDVQGTWIASSVSSGEPDYMLDIVKSYRKRGYKVHSCKVGGDIDKDLARIRFLEKNRLPDERILYDVNRAWTRREASIVMNGGADLGITVEQPCETLDDIAALRQITTTPISVDESLVTLQDATRIARDGLAEVFGIKLNRVGGLTKAARMRDVALAHGIQMYIMATGGSVLADTEAAILAQTIPQEFRLGTWVCQDMLTVDVAPGQGARNVDGNEFIDYLIGSGPMLLGHGHPEVLDAVLQQVPKGMTFFANNALGIELAQEIGSAVACAEQVRFVSSGGEADMYAIRLTRAFTGRSKFLKFEGGYHGMSAEAQMSLAPIEHVNFPLAIPDSAGIPDGVRDEVLIAPFNDIEFVRSLLAEMKMQSNALDAAGIAHKIIGDETLFDILFTDAPIRNYRDTLRADTDMNTRYNETLRKNGILKSSGKMYPCLALTEQDLAHTQQAVDKAVSTIVN